MLERGALEMGHARALLALEGLNQDQAAQHVVDKGLSVRQTEGLVRGFGKTKSNKQVSGASNRGFGAWLW